MSGATVKPVPSPMRRHRVHKGRRTAPGPDERVDTLLGMVMALTSEVAVLRERLDAHERLAIAGTAATPTNVDGYTPDAAALEQRTAARQRIIDKVCRPLIAAGGAEAASDD
ncbi:MAG: hypothetical protein R3E65_09160 [Steroidobacteraceae bacterium]